MNRDKIRQAFDKYTANYNMSDPNVWMKYYHTGKVAQNCDAIAISLGLSDEEQDIAWTLGMLHDVGRFEQLRRFNTFNDAISIDHANFGADLLFNEGLIYKFIDGDKHYDVIEKAIRYHSLLNVPEGVTERELMFCDIIRDADKVDIFRACYETGMATVYQVTEAELLNSVITPEVFDVFLQERTIPKNIRKTVADNLVGHAALNFELVYPMSRQIAKEQGFIWKLLDVKFEDADTIEKVKIMREKLEQLYVNE